MFKGETSLSRGRRTVATLMLAIAVAACQSAHARAQERAVEQPAAPPAEMTPPATEVPVQAPSSPPTPPRVAPDLRQAHATALLIERQSWRDRNTSVLGPVLLVAGIVFTAISAAPFWWRRAIATQGTAIPRTPTR